MNRDDQRDSMVEVDPVSDDGLLSRAVEGGDLDQVRRVLDQLGPEFRLSRIELIRRAHLAGHLELAELLRSKAEVPGSALELVTASLVAHVPVQLFIRAPELHEDYRVVFSLDGERVTFEDGPLRPPEVVHGLQPALERLVALFLFERDVPGAEHQRDLLERVPAFRDLDPRQLAFAGAIAEDPDSFVWSQWLEVSDEDFEEGWLTALSLDFEDQPPFGCAIQARRSESRSQPLRASR